VCVCVCVCVTFSEVQAIWATKGAQVEDVWPVYLPALA
jgi:D-serine deaminase-like pyridoxal phosphate-dependent protein